LDLSPLGHEVGQGLRFDYGPRVELHGERAKFNGPLDNLAISISVVEDVAEREGGHDLYFVRLEVVLEFPGHDEDGVQELLDLWVVHLGVTKDVTNEVD
jgi:hypothetical protein